MKVCSFQKISYAYRSGFFLQPKWVLRHLSFSISEGQSLAILGPNGSGKTTLLHLLVGLKRPWEGNVEIFGKPVRSISIRKEIGFLPERIYFYPFMSAWDFLIYVGSFSGIFKKELQKKIEHVLKEVLLWKERFIPIGRFSKGMRQRLGLAQAFLHEPRFLILDEPMSGLDPEGREFFTSVLYQKKQAGVPLVFTSHVLSDAWSLCDQVLQLDKNAKWSLFDMEKEFSPTQWMFEVAFQGLYLEQAKALHVFFKLFQISGGIRAVLKVGLPLEKALQALSEKGARVLWVKPLSASMKALLLKEAQKFSITEGGF